MKPQTKTRKIQLATKQFLAGEINFKELISGIDRRYRRCYLAGAIDTSRKKNPYKIDRNRGFNKYRHELFKQGGKARKIIFKELF